MRPLLILAALPFISAYDGIKMLCLVNSQRAQNSLPALGLDSRLTQSAQQHSNDQASSNEMSHTGSDGSSPGQRITDVGYDWSSFAENVAFGYSDEETVMNAWMNSPGHRANILSSKVIMFGSAVAYGNNKTPYYTQDFGNDGTGVKNVPKCDGTDKYPKGSGGSGSGNGSGSSGESGGNAPSNPARSTPSRNHNGPQPVPLPISGPIKTAPGSTHSIPHPAPIPASIPVNPVPSSNPSVPQQTLLPRQDDPSDGGWHWNVQNGYITVEGYVPQDVLTVLQKYKQF